MYHPRIKLERVVVILALFISTTQASTITIGPNGINSAGLLNANLQPLTGAGVVIGQVEEGRPGDSDVGDDPSHRNTTTDPAGVFEQSNPNEPTANSTNISDHAQQVAGVMISTDATDPQMDGEAPKGVAIGASLFSSAYITLGTNPGYQDAILTFQFIATRTGMRAVNHSWGKPLDFGVLDGNSLLTLALDWSATNHDVLHVFAGTQGSGGMPVPRDNYNGMTIARSVKVGSVYRQASAGNFYDEDAFGDRTSTSLLAPGDGVELTGLGNIQNRANGTSFAAPHVTATVALLQEFGENRILAAAPHWNANARRHEVMKAVLINSADKLLDTGNGNFLGMEREVVDTAGENWLLSNAFSDDEIPLDIQMGAGHLNANRALKQFRHGEFDSDAAAVPVVGWDYGQTSGDDDINTYVFSKQLRAGSYISLSLAWDRDVLFETDVDMDGAYDSGDTFIQDCCFTNLDLYLMPPGATSLAQAVASSISSVMSVEHIFFEIPTTQQYEIWVHQFNSQFGDPRTYALAWWAVASNPATSQGDFDGSGIVDQQDYLIWRGAFGTNNASADANGNGVVDAADYVIWRNNLGQQPGSGSATAVPEPASAVLLVVAGAVLAGRCRARRGVDCASLRQ